VIDWGKLHARFRGVSRKMRSPARELARTRSD
jgi:hypothetical protein